MLERHKINKALLQMMQHDLRRIHKWSSAESLNDVLELITEIYMSAEMFTETGYLSTLARLPKNS